MAAYTKKIITFQEKLRIYEALKESVEVLEDGYCRYLQSDMTDAKFASQLDAERFTEKHVMKVRTDNFGKLRPATLANNNAEVFDALRASIATLSASLDSANKMIEQDWHSLSWRVVNS